MKNHRHTKLSTQWKAQNLSEKTGVPEADILAYLDEADINRYHEELKTGQYGYKDLGKGGIIATLTTYLAANQSYTLAGITALSLLATLANPFVERYLNRRLGQLIKTVIKDNRKGETPVTGIVIDMDGTSPV